MASKVLVLFTNAESEVEYEGISAVTFVNGESHGMGPVGNVSPGTSRLILHSNRVDAVLIKRDAE